MKYFDESFIRFFKGLIKNNNKAWFDKNKPVYEESVKKPFEVLVADIIKELKGIHPGFQCEPKEAIFRLNRDIRFSADKTPYKSNTSALITHGGKKNMSDPGLYVELSANNLSIYGGVYMPDKVQLSGIRTAILNHPDEIKKLKADKKFKALFGEIKGEVNKVLPPEFKVGAKTEPLIFNKQFYFMAKYTDDKDLLGQNLVPFIMKHYMVGLPWSQFLFKAIH